MFKKVRWARGVVLFFVAVMIAGLAAGCSSSGKTSGAPPDKGGSAQPAPSSTTKAAGKTQELTLASGSAGGIFYISATSFADLINKKAPSLHISVETSGGIAENIRMIDQKKVNLAMGNTDMMFKGFNGIKPFDHKMDVRWIIPYTAAPFKVVTLKKAKIKTPADLKGKVVSPGERGGAPEDALNGLLTAEGIGKNDLKITYLEESEAMEALKQGRLQAYVLTGADPYPAIQQLAESADIDIMSFTEETLTRLNKQLPAYIRSTIPASMYKGLAQDVKTLESSGGLMTGSGMDADTVYQITKTIMEGKDDLGKVHPVLKRIGKLNKSNLSGIPTPFHPGAEKYFKEMGLL